MLLTLTIVTQAPQENSEAIAGGVSKILQSSHGNIWVGVSYKVASLQVYSVIKKETPTQVFSCEN